MLPWYSVCLICSLACPSFNYSKFCELPYHAFKCDPSAFGRSSYLTDLTWLYHKLNATGCIHLLNDLNLLDDEQINNHHHLAILKKFLMKHMRPLNYDASQFYTFLPPFVDGECSANESLKTDEVVSKWLVHFDTIPIPYFTQVSDPNAAERSTSSDDLKQRHNGYDVVQNLGGDGYFVATMSVDREEICVWDVTRGMKVRTLNGIPQPMSLCPVGDYRAAVLCRREIKVIDLDGGSFKVRCLIWLIFNRKRRTRV